MDIQQYLEYSYGVQLCIILLGIRSAFLIQDNEDNYKYLYSYLENDFEKLKLFFQDQTAMQLSRESLNKIKTVVYYTNYQGKNVAAGLLVYISDSLEPWYFTSHENLGKQLNYCGNFQKILQQKERSYYAEILINVPVVNIEYQLLRFGFVHEEAEQCKIHAIRLFRKIQRFLPKVMCKLIINFA